MVSRFKIPRGAAWLLMLCLLPSMTVFASPREGTVYGFSPEPAWIKPARPQYDAQATSSNLTNGTWYLMLDHQIQITASGDDQYRHVALQVVNASGVEAQSQLDFEVDPSFQTLSFHTLKLVRNGTVVDERTRARITALPQESALEQHVYNGSYRIDVVLSDVQVGDIIEYEYTVHSEEKLFPGHYSARLSTAWSVPVLWQHIRISYPRNRSIRYRFSAAPITPQTVQNGDRTELDFTWENLAAIPSDRDRPNWYQTWPELEFSDFADWAAVAERTNPLFAIAARSRPKVEAAVASLRAAGGPPERQVLHALQMVQEDVRYTSISIGRGSHVPTDPETILERRFGDCKDKALLLATLLQKLGIDARPALVHSELGPNLEHWLPTPYAFNHAIVRVRIGPSIYWLDGTASKQYSALRDIAPPEFAFALPVDPQIRALEKIPRPTPDSGSRIIESTIDISKGVQENASFSVDTRYQGSEADSIRRSFAKKSSQQRQSEYLNYYTRHYPGIKTAGDVTVNDDLDNNVLTTHEHYLIEHPFRIDDKGKATFSVRIDEFYRYGRTLDSAVRKAPLAIDYPDHIQQNFIVKLPEDWEVKNDSTQIDNPAFKYRSSTTLVGHDVKLNYEYEALSDHVDPDALAQYAQDRSKLYNDLDFTFTHHLHSAPKAAAPLAIAVVPFFTGLLSLALGIWLMWRFVYRYDPPPRSVPAGTASGIAGWLLLPALNVLVYPIMFLVLTAAFGRFFDVSMWQVLPTIVSPQYAALAQPFALGMLVSSALVLPLTVTVALLFFRKRSSTPIRFVIQVWIAAIVSLLLTNSAAAGGIKTVAKFAIGPFQLLKDVLILMLWSAYMLRSKRVKATFTKRWREPVQAPEPAPAAHGFAADGPSLPPPLPSVPPPLPPHQPS